jgi:transposase
MTESLNEKSVPNPEVLVPKTKLKRRKHTAQYKLRILKEADAARNQTGAISALLRREGLYASVLTDWTKQRDKGTLAAFSKKRGVKSKSYAKKAELESLIAQNKRLEARLRQANLIIEAQKKISELMELSAELNS